MGEEIAKSRFCPEDFAEFKRRLEIETRLLKKLLEEKAFTFSEPKVGFELEAWLIDERMNPAPVNEPLLKNLNNPCVVHELAKFNVELNTSPFAIHNAVFSNLCQELNRLWELCQAAARPLNSQIAMIGILPTLQPEMLSLAHMTPSQRYAALNEQIMKHRGGRPLTLDIRGEDRLQIKHDNVMLEATATSLQIHFNIPQLEAIHYCNASLLLSPAMVALAANSPFLFGKRLWDESRIPVFEQAVQVDAFNDPKGFSVGRVSFGSGFLKESIFELFQENLQRYPPLLPICFSDGPEGFRHLKLHNGTIWRWNRPLVGEDHKGTPQLRLEHRVAAAGPSVPDVIANVAFFVGALHYYTHQKVPPGDRMEFDRVRESFYRAARDGLNAKVFWMEGREVPMRDLLLQELIPHAQKGLRDLGVSKEDIETFLEEIVVGRVQKMKNGALWQRHALERSGGDFRKMTEDYVLQQRAGLPVHEWS
jgi:gamma-glutamyl:cysteine ligase YbdK (ATP-grasp superfamily)